MPALKLAFKRAGSLHSQKPGTCSKVVQAALLEKATGRRTEAPQPALSTKDPNMAARLLGSPSSAQLPSKCSHMSDPQERSPVETLSQTTES